MRIRMLFSKQKIESFDSVRLTVTGMRCAQEFELLCKGDKTEVALYDLIYTDGEKVRRLNKSVAVDTADVLSLLNECCLLKWDGFCGANPRGVCDGYMFELRAEVNAGRTIGAHGSNNYPRRYHQLKNGIMQMLNK